MQKPTSADEIDLIELAVKAFRFFQRNFLLFVLSTGIGSGIGACLYFVVPDVYVSKMVIQSDILTESYSDRIAESIDNLIRERNYKLLSKRLGLTDTETKDLQSIKIESIKKSNEADKKEESIFIVTSEVRSKAIIPKLQDGVVNYLRNNEFVKIRVQQRIVYFQKLIESIEVEIKSLDTIKQKLLSGKPIYGNSTGGMMLIDPTNVYNQMIDLKRQQLDYQNALELANSIQLVEGFTVYEKPAEPKLSKAMVVGFVLGFFSAMVIIFARWLLKTSQTYPQ
jgi:hypothetical protein